MNARYPGWRTTPLRKVRRRLGRARLAAALMVPHIKNSQEVLCVLRGSVELIHGDERITLSEGDAVHYWSVPEKQLVTGRSKGRAAVLWVGTL